MPDSEMLERARVEGWTDEDVVRRVCAGDVPLFELLMRRHNQRIYRAIRSILRDDTETEDVMQETYVRAFHHLSQFQGRAQFSTWLTRIAVHEAIRVAALRGRFDPLDLEKSEPEEHAMFNSPQLSATPEDNAIRGEVGSILEKAILALPDSYRAVVMLRDLEQMSTAEAAEALSLSESNVKVRLHRAHELLRDELLSQARDNPCPAFAFHAKRCDRIVAAVLDRLARPSS